MNYSMELHSAEGENCWEVKVIGEVDIFNSNEFKEKLNALVKEKSLNLRIDCSDLMYIDSTGLGALVSVLKNVKLYGGDIFLVGLKQALCKLFRITNLDKVFILEGEEYE